jgi:hypothetical protein
MGTSLAAEEKKETKKERNHEKRNHEICFKEKNISEEKFQSINNFCQKYD